ncbi:phosphodiester glycosidase family protein [Candidatus Sumerlaeota bacterium]|nr:phosphodiester glycosidase family protein [Candidatus Sumerlaeota bacterium]
MEAAPVDLACQLRSLSHNDALGLNSVEWKNVDPDEKQLADFVEFLSALVACNADFDRTVETISLHTLGNMPVDWTRHRVCLFPVFIEKLILTNHVESNVEGLPLRIERQGVWTLEVSALTAESHKANIAAWTKLIAAREALKLGGGLSVNALELSRQTLEEGALDLRPLVLHALRQDGGAVDRGRTFEQHSIANSFWQTYWATGALRSQRGVVFPVAFMPIDRSWNGEFRAPFKERWINAHRKIYGRSAILAWVNEALTNAKALLFNIDKCVFGVAKDFSAEAHGLEDADVDLALSELNRCGFVDSYIGANKEKFAKWAESETALGRGKSFDANAIASCVRLNPTDEHTVAIRRVVPFAGAAYLSQVVHDTKRLIEDGKIQDLDGEIIAATNSTFFLNFPEEYCNIHSAMNDPVSTLIENGKTRQCKTLRRAAFVLAEDGEAHITTTGSNKLLADALLYEAEFSSGNAFKNAGKPGRENQFGPLYFGAVIVGNSIVETFEECATEIPNNGWVMGDSEAFGGAVEPEDAVHAMFRSDDGQRELKVRHAFSIGPMLLQDGHPVEFGTSGEEFMPVQLKEPMNADETAELSRATMPSALRDCIAKGVPPTRFPHDWNTTRAPRTALGVRPNGTIVLAVVDGRADLSHSIGVTLAELACVMQNLGCCEAMNMDGGGSSVMFINDAEAAKHKLRPKLRDGVVNLPSDAGGVERMLPVPLILVRK